MRFVLLIATLSLTSIASCGDAQTILRRGSNEASSPITPSLVASVDSCIAPCSIFFDATATTAASLVTYPFHQLHYTINYGDPSSGNYGASNGVGNFSRNVTYGPLGAHVFETPGPYTVTLTVRGPTDQLGTWTSTTTTVPITIIDPAVAFPSSGTKCFSTSGNFTGCPAGASQITTSSYSSIITTYMQTPNTGIMALLRCDETFTYTGIAPTITAPGPGIFATYGGCGKAIIRANSATAVNYMLLVGPVSNWSISDIKLDPDGSTNETLSGVIAVENSTRTLFLRLETMGANRLRIYTAIDTGLTGVVDELTYADNNVISGDVGQVGGGMYFDGVTRFAMLGTNLNNDDKGQHVLRTQKMTKAVFFNNRFENQGLTKAVWTIHGNQRDHEVVGQWVFGDNFGIAGSGNGGGIFSLAPQLPTGANEPIVDVIIERNIFLGSATNNNGNNAPFAMVARKVSHRNNIYNARLRILGQNMLAAYGGTTFPDLNTQYFWSYYNAFLFPSTPSETSRCYRFDYMTLSEVKNNLCYFSAGGTDITMIAEFDSSGNTFSNNTTQGQIKVTSPNWVGGASASMITAAAFALQSPSYGIGTGTWVPVYDDILLTPRGSQFDMGAVKFQ